MKHLLSSRQEFLTMQLHTGRLFLCVRTFFLWLGMMDFMFLFSIANFNSVLLNIYDNGFAFGKCFFSILKEQFRVHCVVIRNDGDAIDKGWLSYIRGWVGRQGGGYYLAVSVFVLVALSSHILSPFI